VKGLEQAYEYRAARAAYQQAKSTTDRQDRPAITRTRPSIDRGRSIGQ
jgi:hypothetical protein